MANILVAASPEPQTTVKRLLASHDLSFALTMHEAKELLRERSFDLIVCTLIFDDSRMFDLLRFAKSKPKWQKIPFVCARVRATINLPETLRAAAFTAGVLGAKAFLDIRDYSANPEQEMQAAIERILAESN
jgi:hypothetical protein